jgi:putative FmdB family regulatory protein
LGSQAGAWEPAISVVINLFLQEITMPIYEFRCMKCNEYFEILVTRSDEEVEMGCPKCKSEDFERVLSTTSYAMGDGGAAKASGVKTITKECSSGSCTTYEVPGLTR